jgi:hypothetical protein
MAGVERMHEVRGDTVGAFEVAHMRSIIVAVVATVAIIGAAQAQDLAAKRVAPEIGSAGYSIAAEERRHAAYPRRPPSQQSQDDLAAKRVAPEIGSAGYSIAAEERRHAAYPRRRSHCRPPQYVTDGSERRRSRRCKLPVAGALPEAASAYITDGWHLVTTKTLDA